LETIEKPKLRSSTEVLIKVHAISLNARDNQIVNGTYGAPIQEGVVVVSGKCIIRILTTTTGYHES